MTLLVIAQLWIEAPFTTEKALENGYTCCVSLLLKVNECSNQVCILCPPTIQTEMALALVHHLGFASHVKCDKGLKSFLLSVKRVSLTLRCLLLYKLEARQGGRLTLQLFCECQQGMLIRSWNNLNQNIEWKLSCLRTK